MKHITFYLFLFLSACFYSCDQERSGMSGEKGYLYLDIEKNVTLQTKAYHIDLNVLILDEAEDTVKFIPSFDQTAENDNILLEAGAYQVVITSGSPDSAVWETPYFYGKEDFRIVANEVSVVKVTCKIANTKVTVDYSDAFKNYFTDYSTTVSNVSGSLEYKKGETRGGFFGVDKLTTLLKLINKDGQHFELKRVFPDIKERCHYKLKFSIGEDVPDGDTEAGGNFDITVDETADTVFVRIPIEVEDLNNLKVPEFKLTGFNDKNVLSFTAGKAKENTLVLNAANKIETLLLSIESDDLNKGGLTSLDLIKLQPAERQKLEAIKFPIPQTIKGATELTFDLTEMAHLLPAYELSMQSHRFTFTVMDEKHQEQIISFTYEVKLDVGVITYPVDPWAMFVVLKGSTPYTDGIGFRYKKVGDEDWQEVLATSQNEEGDFKCLLTGLLPYTKYVYKAICKDADGIELVGTEVEFTTTFTNQDENGKFFVPNLGFDDWSTYSDKKSAMANAPGEPIYWDSGNRGANTIKEVNPTSKETTVIAKIEGNIASAKLESKKVNAIIFNVFAAGNIYSGSFIEAVVGGSASASGALLDFGQIYKGGKPTTLSGYYKYTPKQVNWGGHKELQSGNMDKCSIYIALCDWTAPFRINTQAQQFIDFSSSDIIAYGELDDDKYKEAETDANGFKHFTIDIKYRDLTKKPCYVVIVASASKYGDYFTGGEGSTLYIDEFKLGYDYNPASFVGTELEGLEPANKQIKDK